MSNPAFQRTCLRQAADGERWHRSSMPRTLIAYSTIDGHTLKICSRLKNVLQRNGHASELFEIGKADSPNVSAFDKVVIGASIRYGKYRPTVYRFIEANRSALDEMPTAFFSVNVVARKPGKDTPELNPYIKVFKRNTTWRPNQFAVFAGKLDFPSYGLLDRQVIRLIMWLTGGPTDPATCIEFTDWQAVDKFALQISNAGSADPNDLAQSQPSARATNDALAQADR